MNITDLLAETPLFKPEELPARNNKPFVTHSSLNARFEPIGHIEHNDFFVFIAKNLSCAIIGIPGVRDTDKAEGMRVVGTVEFKPSKLINGFGLIDINHLKNVLQVGLVHVSPAFQRMGVGLNLYATLADAGYIIISDNTQYVGGKELWKRIAKECLSGRYVVHVVDNGNVRLKNNLPVTYNGSNIDDSELWSLDSSKKYTLFILKKP